MRYSTGLVNRMMDTGSFRDIFIDCAIDVYSGVAPASADNPPTGTRLATITRNGLPLVAAVNATCALTLSGSSGAVTAVRVNSLDVLGETVNWVGDLPTTVLALAAQINRNPKNLLFIASASGAVLTLTALPGLGDMPNGWSVSLVGSGLTAGASTMSGGVVASNALRFDVAADGAVAKPGGENWSGVGAANGVAGWFRLRESGDNGAASTVFARADGTCATSGGDMTLGSLTISADAPFVLPVASFTLPRT